MKRIAYKKSDKAFPAWNIVEKSSSSASLFWMSEVPRPLTARQLAILIKTIVKAITPYSFGSSNRASTTETTKLTSCEDSRSPKRQINPLIVLDFISSLFSILVS